MTNNLAILVYFIIRRNNQLGILLLKHIKIGRKIFRVIGVIGIHDAYVFTFNHRQGYIDA